MSCYTRPLLELAEATYRYGFGLVSIFAREYHAVPLHEKPGVGKPA